MFRRRPRKDHRMSTEASLAEAEAARRAQEKKQAAEKPVAEALARIQRENDVAHWLRIVLGGE